ncbi:MAG TPA: fumarylacetoacetate hydrolase family protein [Thermoleophilaceae bacterium]|jgi:2-keto-4-pentenoate hydratase/2-oxohepta-3-ene-1,7-dioic acid hydratase in catechol pathway|nr:fumarylacetoacetate hydrolase family protein [Thermoleophilaceae bacterium]
MRVANVSGRLAADTGSGFADVAKASDGRFGPSPQAVYDDWEAFSDWAHSASVQGNDMPDPALLGPPVPEPRQVFAVALNYPEHAAEGGFTPPDTPLIFTKYPTCLAGAHAEVELPTPMVDWEVELVAVIGKPGAHVAEVDAWGHVAGVTVGQDLSARDVQRRGPAPQFSLGKSFPGFGPIGPWVVTTDEFGPRDVQLECVLNGETVQSEMSAEMIFSVPQLIAYISAITPLLPGDLLFTGTPSGVGARRDPPRFLRDADELTSRIEGVGEIFQTFHDNEKGQAA